MGLVIIAVFGISSMFSIVALELILEHIEETRKNPWDD